MEAYLSYITSASFQKDYPVLFLAIWATAEQEILAFAKTARPLTTSDPFRVTRD
jgi:hypothetical protein